MRELGVVLIKADFTRRPDWMAEELKTYGRAGVPANVILPAGRPASLIVLPELFSKGTLIAKLKQAGPSIPDAAAANPVSSTIAP
jgi:thiol:disulfide interchange protein